MYRSVWFSKGGDNESRVWWKDVDIVAENGKEGARRCQGLRMRL